MKRFLAITIFASLPCTAFAQQATEAGKESPWSGTVTLGYLATSGNTENTSLNTEFNVGYVSGNWSHDLRGRAIKSDQNNVNTAENYQLGWLSDYDFSETSFMFGRVEWRKDKFAGVVEQTSETVGYGRRILNTEKHILNAEIGAGAKQIESSDGSSDNEGIARAGLDYKWQISESAEFNQDLILESGSSNTFFESITAVKANLIGELALVASYTIRNNSDVPVGTEKADTFTALSLEYAW